MIGLVSEEEKSKLPVDYSISVQELYTGLASYWIKEGFDFWDLAIGPKAIRFLPSWVPDWTSCHKTENKSIEFRLQLPQLMHGGIHLSLGSEIHS